MLGLSWVIIAQTFVCWWVVHFCYVLAMVTNIYILHTYIYIYVYIKLKSLQKSLCESNKLTISKEVWEAFSRICLFKLKPSGSSSSQNKPSTLFFLYHLMWTYFVLSSNVTHLETTSPSLLYAFLLNCLVANTADFDRWMFSGFVWW